MVHARLMRPFQIIFGSAVPDFWKRAASMEEEGDDGAGVHEAVRVLARLAGDAEEHVRAQARGLPLVLHELFPAAHDAAFWGRVWALLEEEGGGMPAAPPCSTWCACG